TKGGRMHSKSIWAACLAALMGCISCSNLKYLPEGEQLYVKGEVEIETDTIPERYIEPLSDNLEELLRPKPNTTILGMRPQLYLYNIAGEPKSDDRKSAAEATGEGYSGYGGST